MTEAIKKLRDENDSLRQELDAQRCEVDKLKATLEASKAHTRRSLALARMVAGQCQEHECFLDGTVRRGQ